MYYIGLTFLRNKVFTPANFLVTSALAAPAMWGSKQVPAECVILFTKYPEPGATKSRLVPAVGALAAARIQMLMTEHMLTKLCTLGDIRPSVKLYVYYTGDNCSKMKTWLGRRFAPAQLEYRAQTGGDLGDRIISAFQDAFAAGHKAAVVVGGDIPGVTPALLAASLARLRAGDEDVLLGPAEDGGYYLVGVSAGSRAQLGALFGSGIDWGTDRVFAQQTAAARQCDLKLGVLDATLSDVDVEADLPVFERELSIPVSELVTPTVSVVLPVLNEAHNIEAAIHSLISTCEAPSQVDVVVADGGSGDGTAGRARAALAQHACLITGTVVDSAPGRGRQLSAGVSSARGSVLLFLHADTRLPRGWDRLARQAAWTPGTSVAAFRFGLDVLHQPEAAGAAVPWWTRLQMSLLTWGTNLRAELAELPYGDQSLFMRSDIYHAIGGFKPYRLFEDYDLVQRARAVGRVKIVDAECITSWRRWQKHGYFKVTGFNSLLILAYKLGVPPDTLADWYYGKASALQAPPKAVSEPPAS